MAEVKIDESDFDDNKRNAKMDRNSRSIAALGVEVFRAMESLRVLVVGLQGVGVETAKNVILGGPKAVTVYDPEITRIEDMGSNFYLKASDVGKSSRADASISELKSLNPYVDVQVHSGALDEEFLHSFGVVIVTSLLSKKELVRINEICRSRKTVINVTDKKAQEALGFIGGVQNPITASFPVTFILALTSGPSALFFSDFGNHHQTHDANGEPKKLFVIESIKEDGTVVLGEKVKHNLDDGAMVKITEAEGLGKLCGLDSVKIKRVYDEWDEVDAKTGKKRHRQVQKFNEFKIDLSGTRFKDFAELGHYINGGIATEVKPIQDAHFLSLAESLDNPAPGNFFLSHPDQEKMYSGRGNQLQLGYQALFEFQDAHGRLPELHSAADADKLVATANAIKARRDAAADGSVLKIEAVDEDAIKKLALYARTELTGYSAFLGGVAGQEVVKRFGKFTPVSQYLVSDHFELLQADVPADAKPKGSRYDYQISIFGQAIQDKIMNQKWFMVGCGALGCEYLKGMALMGLGAGPNGKVTITDGDSIELSNLSRQFLFRHHHIGKSKALCGAEVAKSMNPDLNLVTLQDMVMPQTENVFTDAFWDGLDGAWNALDNVHARKYVDQKCLFHEKPLLESGTEGTKTNSEVIVPHKTRSYNDAQDAESEGIPQCTLRNFPNLIEHCIEWAKPRFQDLFQLGPDNFNLMLEDSKKFRDQVVKEGGEGKQLLTLRGVKALYENTQKRTFEQCLHLAFVEFADAYYLKIKDLIHYFPHDAKVKDEHGNETGPFWTGAKRFPSPALWDPAHPDQGHFYYLFNAANLYAVMFGLEPVRDEKEFRAQLDAAKLVLPEWVPGDKPELEEKKDAAEAAAGSDKDQINALFAFFAGLDRTKVTALKSQKFEKDDDENFHVDFVTACANQRALNYKIQPATRLSVKVIAGKIIPALATTTALITGLIELEYYKLVLNLGLDKIRNANINLAVSTFNFFEPMAPISAQKEFDVAMQEDIVPVPAGFTSWDKITINEGNLTLKEFLEVFPKKHHGVKIKALVGGDGKSFLYDEDDTSDEQLNSKVVDLYVKAYGPLVTADRKYVILDGTFESAEGETCKVPRIKFVF